MAEITFETTEQDIASRSLHVTVPLDRLQAVERRTVERFSRQARLPGFRKGHAPEPVVRRRFEQEIRQHVLEDALRESWDLIRKETAIEPLADPQVRNLSFESGQPLTFDLQVEVRPRITLARTGGFALTRTVSPVTDEAVSQQLEQLRVQRATWTPLDGVQPRPGQLVSVSVTTLTEGVEPGEPAGHQLVLGRGEAIPDLEERIAALHPGETSEGEVRFPDDHTDPALRGATRRVRVTLHEVKEQVLPALDDSFARELGEFGSLDELTQRVREDLERDAAREADAGVREQLIGELVAANDVPAPESLVNRLVRAYAERYGIPPEQLEAFVASFRPVAERQVQRELVLEAVATAQNLRATDEDLDTRVAELARARGVEPGKLYASLQQAGRLGELELAITEERTFGWLLAQSTVTEGSA
jgi:trigger factor